MVAERDANSVRDHLACGGLVLGVKTAGAEQERRAMAILRQRHAQDVHVRDLRAEWSRGKAMAGAGGGGVR